jgi:uncharacterized protein (TIGR04255 family)
MGDGADEIVSFTNPPVVEVVCGAQFHALPLQTVHFGQFGQRISSYRQVIDSQPIAPAVEPQAGAPIFLQTFSFALPGLPELRRVVFIDDERGHLVQLQTNRFHHNWQHRPALGGYPRFREVRSAFLERWTDFTNFLTEVGLTPPNITQYEMSYVNHVPAGTLWDSPNDLSKLFPWLSANRNTALDGPSDVEIALHYDVPACRGRLHVGIKTGTRQTDGVRVVQMELMVRGAPSPAERTPSEMSDWMASARDGIVRSFADLTGPQAHAHWGRTK